MQFRAEATLVIERLEKSMTTPRGRLLLGSLPMLHSYVRRLVGNGERANDILQETSLRMLTTEGPTDPERYAAWGRGVVRHVLAHDWRTRRRAQSEQPFEEDLLDESSPPCVDTEAHLDARASVARIAVDLDCEGVVLLYRRYVLQETARDLADELAQSPAAMRMRLMRLRSRALAVGS